MLSIKVKYRKILHRNRLVSVFYPGKSKENRIAVLNEYKHLRGFLGKDGIKDSLVIMKWELSVYFSECREDRNLIRVKLCIESQLIGKRYC